MMRIELIFLTWKVNNLPLIYTHKKADCFCEMLASWTTWLEVDAGLLCAGLAIFAILGYLAKQRLARTGRRHEPAREQSVA